MRSRVLATLIYQDTEAFRRACHLDTRQLAQALDAVRQAQPAPIALRSNLSPPLQERAADESSPDAAEVLDARSARMPNARARPAVTRARAHAAAAPPVTESPTISSGPPGSSVVR